MLVEAAEAIEVGVQHVRAQVDEPLDVGLNSGAQSDIHPAAFEDRPNPDYSASFAGVQA